jgi:threonine dehydrogenase-like Zn-dependent dehydrogenase
MQHIRVSTFAGPGAKPVIHSVPWPKIPSKAALIQIGACGVCGTDLHILKGHWPKQLPWPFTLGHELGGVIVEAGSEFKEDFMSKPLKVGSRVMIPPLMPCGRCYYCIHYPESANKCLTPVYYGRYLGFDRPPHLWGGFAEYVYVDLEALPGTKIYKLPDDMPLRLGALAEPLTSCIRAFNRAVRVGGFKWGDTVVIQGSGPIGILAVAAAQEMGAGRVICVGAPEQPRLELARKFGAEATVDIERYQTAEARIARVRELVGGFGADLVMDCSGHPSAGPEGIEFLRDGGTYVEMGQFTDGGRDHHVVAPHLRQGHQCARLMGIHRQRPAAWRRHALSRESQISMVRHADAVSVLGRRDRARGRRRHCDENGEIDHRAIS